MPLPRSDKKLIDELKHLDMREQVCNADTALCRQILALLSLVSSAGDGVDLGSPSGPYSGYGDVEVEWDPGPGCSKDDTEVGTNTAVPMLWNRGKIEVEVRKGEKEDTSGSVDEGEKVVRA
jgi:hypothetical protein